MNFNQRKGITNDQCDTQLSKCIMFVMRIFMISIINLMASQANLLCLYLYC